MPSWRWIARISLRRATRILASSADSGSSSSRTCGSNASARARATRCCWPPESWYGIAVAVVGQVDELEQLADPLRDLGPSGACGPSVRTPMLSATVMFGNSAYDWKTIPTLRLFGGRCVMSAPSTMIVPAVGCSKPAIIRSVVVLPQPDGPRNDTNSPRSAAEVEVLDGDDAAEPLLDAGEVEEASSVGSAPPDRGTSSAAGDPGRGEPRPIRAMSAHRDPGQPEADERDRGRLVGLVAAEQREVRPEGGPGQEGRDRELADDDREGQERAAQERRRGGSAG